MEVVSLLHRAALSRLRRALCSKAGVQKGVAFDAFVIEVYRTCIYDDGHIGKKGYLQKPEESRQLVENISCLFDLVDIDSSGKIDWVDFTDFCADVGNNHLFPAGKSGVEDNQEGALVSTSKRSTTFTEKRGYIDRSSHCQEILSLRFVKELQLLLVVEGGQHLLKVYTKGIHRKLEIEPSIAVKRIVIDEIGGRSVRSKQHQRSQNKSERLNTMLEQSPTLSRDNMSVLAAEYIGHGNQAIVSCADGYLTVWDLNTAKLLRYIYVGDVQVGLRFCPAMDVLISWGVDEFHNDFLVWNVETLTAMHTLNGHTAPIRDVCEVCPTAPIDGGVDCKRERNLVTAGMDGRVILWDLKLDFSERSRKPEQVWVIVGGHVHGILSVTYSGAHDIIITAGFDFEAICWDRSTRHIQQRLTGHRHSLIGVAIAEHETERAITGDSGGTFRLWDIGGRRSLSSGCCLQTFSLANVQATQPRTMAVVWGQGLVVAGSKMHVFRVVRDIRPNFPPVGAWFSSHTGNICVLLGGVGLFLNASTGEVVSRVNLSARTSPPGREVTSVCFDAMHKKVLVGDQDGGLHLYSGVSGSWVRAAKPHSAEVSALLYVDRDGTFISVGWDRTIQIHEAVARLPHGGPWRSGREGRSWTGRQCSSQISEGGRNDGVLRSVRQAHDADITAVTFSANLGLLATAAHDLTVRVWDYALLTLEEVLVAHLHELTCLCFLDPLPCLATADAAGKVMLWATRPHPNAWSMLFLMRNTVLVTVAVPTEGKVTIGRGSQGGRGESVGVVREERLERKIAPAPVTAITFHYDPSAIQEQRGSEEGGKCKDNGLPTGKNLHEEEEMFRSSSKYCSEDHAIDERQRSKKQDSERESMQGVQGAVKGTHLEGKRRLCSLLTGDDLGSVRVWDVTTILDRALANGASALNCSSPSEGCSPGKEEAGKYQSIHHRPGPLDGVRSQMAVRLRTLISIAEVLRRLGRLPPHPNSMYLKDREKMGHQVGTCGYQAEGASAPKCTSTFMASPQTSSCASKTLRSKGHELPGNLLDGKELAECHQNQGRGGVLEMQHMMGIHNKVEAVLNASVGEIEPIKSWSAHTDSINSLQIIQDPPSILTCSLDHSVRLFSLDGNQLAVVIQDGQVGQAPWLFRPPIPGRNLAAARKARDLTEDLRRVRRAERQRLATSAFTPASASAAVSVPSIEVWLTETAPDPPVTCLAVPETQSQEIPSHPKCKLKSPVDKSTDILKKTEVPVSPLHIGWTERTGERNEEVQKVRRVQAINQARNVSRGTGYSTQTSRSEGSRGSFSLGDKPRVDVTNWMLEEQRQQRNGRYGGQGKLKDDWDAIERARYSCLGAEQERKTKKRTRMTEAHTIEQISRVRAGFERKGANPPQRPQTAPGTMWGNNASTGLLVRASGAGKGELGKSCRGDGNKIRSWETGDDTRKPGEGLLSESGEGKDRLQPSCSASLQGAANFLSSTLTLKDPMTVVHRKIIPSDWEGGNSSGYDESRNLPASTSECTLVRHRIGSTSAPTLGSPATEQDTPPAEQMQPKATSKETMSSGVGIKAVEGEGWGMCSPTTMPSDRLRQLLSKFELLTEGGSGGQANNLTGILSPEQRKGGGWGKGVRCKDRAIGDDVGGANSSTLQQTAQKHNERYRRAKKHSVGAMNESYQRKLETTVGLSGPCGGRFGPYGLDDVLKFREFISHFDGRKGVGTLNVDALLEAAEVQGDNYTIALLRGMSKASIHDSNRHMSTEDFMQLVFHFAKYEELKRISNALCLMSLVERLRDGAALPLEDDGALLAAGGEGRLSQTACCDIENTFRGMGHDPCGTCTVREMHDMLARAGWEGIPGYEELEATALHNGIEK
ncbi:unnamed protein product [Choristocarpus tenellus]